MQHTKILSPHYHIPWPVQCWTQIFPTHRGSPPLVLKPRRWFCQPTLSRGAESLLETCCPAFRNCLGCVCRSFTVGRGFVAALSLWAQAARLAGFVSLVRLVRSSAAAAAAALPLKPRLRKHVSPAAAACALVAAVGLATSDSSRVLAAVLAFAASSAPVRHSTLFGF